MSSDSESGSRPCTSGGSGADSEYSTENDGDGDHHKNSLPFDPEGNSITSLGTYMEKRLMNQGEDKTTRFSHLEGSTLSLHSEDPYFMGLDESISNFDFDDINRSIEIFFGNLTDFSTFYQSLSDGGFRTPKGIESESEIEGDHISISHINPDDEDLKTTVNPCAVKKLCLVGHPLTCFKGLNSFKKLTEAWITNCFIKVVNVLDFVAVLVLIIRMS
jgi:hypothetical protein